MKKGQKSPPKYEVPDNIKETVRSLIKNLLKNENITVEQLANKLNETYGRSASRTNIQNKLARASFSLSEFIQIVNAYGYELELKKLADGRSNSESLPN